MTRPSDSSARLRLLLARAALAAAALTFVVIVASAFMRHAQVGLGCDDWPACYGRFDDDAANGAPTPAVRIVRIAHRLAATGVLALVVGLTLVAWTQRPPWKKEGLLAAAALALTAALAVLGIATPGARMPAVTLGNLLGGYVLLATLAATAAVARSLSPDVASPRDALLRWLALAVLAFVVVQAALGGSIGAQYALPACATLGKCPGFPFDEFRMTAALDPFRPLSVVDGRVVPPGDAAGVFVIHRTLAIVAAVLVLIVAWHLRGMHRVLARTLAALVVATPLAGVAAVAAVPSLSLTVAHNACSALLVAMLAVAVAQTAPTTGSP